MSMLRGLDLRIMMCGFLLLLASSMAARAQQKTGPDPSIGSSDLAGVVKGPNGPEAGVWVIAETTDLPTRYVKIVVTDEGGRFVLPELPSATYSVWARGYGLVDSPNVQTAPGKVMDITAMPAPNAAAAAEYYPAIYWYAMLQVPKKSEFPLANVKSQEEWLN